MNILSNYINNIRNNQGLYKKIKSCDNIVLGPWMGELGPELLYWIPFLNKLSNDGLFEGKNVIAISRGGVESWYSNITHNYYDIFNFINKEEFKLINKMKNTEKQLQPLREEMEIVQMICTSSGISNYELIHPQIMWKSLLDYIQGRKNITWVASQVDFKPFQVIDKYKMIVDSYNLPEEFVFAKFYSSVMFPDTNRHKELVGRIISKITEQMPIITTGIGKNIDEHSDFEYDSSKIIDLSDKLLLNENLGVQTELIRRSQAFIGTYGGMAYLPFFLNVPSISYKTSPSIKYLPTHLMHMQFAELVSMRLNVQNIVINTDAIKGTKDLIINL